jgi:hypothetical protein
MSRSLPSLTFLSTAMMSMNCWGVIDGSGLTGKLHLSRRATVLHKAHNKSISGRTVDVDHWVATGELSVVRTRSHQRSRPFAAQTRYVLVAAQIVMAMHNEKMSKAMKIPLICAATRPVLPAGEPWREHLCPAPFIHSFNTPTTSPKTSHLVNKQTVAKRESKGLAQGK